MTEETKKPQVASKQSPFVEKKEVVKEQSVQNKMSDEEVWIRIYSAVISGNVNAAAQAASIADKGLEEFKSKMRS